jgi:glycosyltransferase involved in cell wall biosynthesis
MSEQRPRAHVHLSYGSDVDKWRQDFLAGRAPDETPYGFHFAREEGFDVTFSSDAGRGRYDLARRVMSRVFGFDVLHAYYNRHQIRGADVIWTMTEGEAFAVGVLSAVGVVPRAHIIANAVWLLDGWTELSIVRKGLYRYLARYLDTMTVHSEACLAVLRHELPHLRSRLVYFGVNADVFRPAGPACGTDDGPIKVFAPGNDRTRDWDVLLSAFGNDERFRVSILCPWLESERLRHYTNVAVVASSRIEDLLRCYREADVVAVPMRANIYSGITVALEATAMGRPVLSSQTGGVPTYFDGDEVLYAPVGDAVAMREILLSTDRESRRRRAERAHMRFATQGYSTRALAARYAELTRAVL